MAVAIIGGSGVYDLAEGGTPQAVATPYGEVALYRLQLAGEEVLFLNRHGIAHHLPPHRVNYRANIWALHALGVCDVLAVQAVGSLQPHMMPGHFVLLSQFIDWTRGVRPSTFFDGDDGRVVHVDVTQPYCPRVSAALRRAGEFLEERLHSDAVYACMEGPRFETAAEIAVLRQMGADVVGMTSVPEAVLAREAGLCYASVSVVCNWAAGMTHHPLSQHEVLEIMTDHARDLHRLLAGYLAVPKDIDCACPGLGHPHLLPQRAPVG
jgi:5'-methylthioadenosine phosphorylase